MVPNRGSGLTDALLVERARRGDAAAFESLVRKHYRAAYAVALGVLGSAMDAEDACQDAFVRALERLDELRKPERFTAWLLQIVRNRARTIHSYRRVRAAQPLDTVNAAGSANPGIDAARGELRDKLEAALQDLSEMQRQVVLLHDLDGWKHRQIAVALEISEVMSRQHLFHARRILRERLGANVLEEYTDE
jgi:RNA polymerase sigma-70 factor (ECF subfamily)